MLRNKDYFSDHIASLLCEFDTATLEAIYYALSGLLQEGKSDGLQKFNNRKNRSGR